MPRPYILPQDIVPTTVKDNLCLGHIFCRVIFVPTIGQDNLCQGHIFCRNIFVATTGEDNLCLNVPYIVPTTGHDRQVAGMELVTFLPA